jgi:hypothetical protein
MSKTMNKGQKLDLIVSEISKIKKSLKKLAAHQDQRAKQLGPPKRASAKRPPKTPAQKSAATVKPPAATVKTKKPELVKAVEGAHVAGRAVS